MMKIHLKSGMDLQWKRLVKSRVKRRHKMYIDRICSSFDKSNGYQIEDITREIGKVKISL